MSPADEVWARQSQWSQAADRIKGAIDRWRAILLGLAIAGAVTGTAGAAVMSSSTALGRTLVIVSTICVGLLPVLRPRVTGAALADWTNARAVSEALKTEMYLFLAGAGRYAATRSETALRKAARDAEKIAYSQRKYLIGVEPAERDLPEVTDTATYFTVRAAGQIAYFGGKARRYKKYLARFRTAEVIATVAGVVLGAFAAVFTEAGLSEWVAVATTIAAAVAARSMAGQYEFQMLEYLRTEAELDHIHGAVEETTDPARLRRLVGRSEQVLSAQNRGWMAQLATDPAADSA